MRPRRRASGAPLKDALANGNGNVRIFYLSTAPALFVPIAQRLGETGLATPTSRIVLEKPIGRDLASSRAINDGVGAVFDEQRTFRIDHYLGKETVQNLLVLRFANMLVEPIWSRATIDHVQITVAEETRRRDARGDYYDKSGALRDMVQNHILQLLVPRGAEVAEHDGCRCNPHREAEGAVGAEADRTRQMSRQRRCAGSTRPASSTAQGARLTRRRSASASRTETFVAIKAEVDNWRWAGVPFYLRTGKRMGVAPLGNRDSVQGHAGADFWRGRRRAEQAWCCACSRMKACGLWLNMKEPGPGGLRVKTAPLDLSFAEEFGGVRYPDAYERLLMDVVRGNLSLFMRRDEVDAAWTWADALLAAWDAGWRRAASLRCGLQWPDAIGGVAGSRWPRLVGSGMTRDATQPSKPLHERIIERSAPRRRRYLDLIDATMPRSRRG